MSGFGFVRGAVDLTDDLAVGVVVVFVVFSKPAITFAESFRGPPNGLSDEKPRWSMKRIPYIDLCNQ